MNRRSMFKALPALAAAGVVQSQEEAAVPDIVTREIDIMPFTDGVLFRHNGVEIPVALVQGVGEQGYSLTKSSGQIDSQDSFLPLPSFIDPQENDSIAFNIYFPEEGDSHLFEDPMPGRPLTIRPAPSQLGAKAGSPKGNTSDGTIRQKWDKWELCRFEAHGIIRNDLNPTCVAGRVEGIWIKLDLIGFDSWNPFEWDRWHTYAEGSLGRIVDSPGQYQFHWTKPRVCSTGISNRTAVYNGIYKMLQDLVKEVLGKVGKWLDDLVKASKEIAQLITDALMKWLTPANNGNQGGQPGGQPGGGGQQQPQGTFNLQASPPVVTVKRGQAAYYTINVSPSGGFNSYVDLKVGGSTGSRVSVSPSRLRNGQARVSLVTTKTGSRVGTHSLTITGTGGGVKKETKVTVIIQS